MHGELRRGESGAPRSPADVNEQKLASMIEGTWIMVDAVLGDRELSAETIGAGELVLVDGTYTFQDDRGTYAVDSTTHPKSMTITGIEGPNRGKVFLAVYELRGDELRICYDLEGAERPAEFATQPDSRQFLATYRRKS